MDGAVVVFLAFRGYFRPSSLADKDTAFSSSCTGIRLITSVGGMKGRGKKEGSAYVLGPWTFFLPSFPSLAMNGPPCLLVRIDPSVKEGPPLQWLLMLFYCTPSQGPRSRRRWDPRAEQMPLFMCSGAGNLKPPTLSRAAIAGSALHRMGNERL